MKLDPEAHEAAAIALFVSVRNTTRKPEDWDNTRGVYKLAYMNDAQAAITAYYNTLPTAAQRAYDEIYGSEEK
ncbi:MULTISPECIES: hypothetical protein [unclassified Glutamicibacter]|uniref:hypothetical protein n=1 Tax=unclassified Glutamicibacter TaxID=2627139 RepID=UPI0037FEF749